VAQTQWQPTQPSGVYYYTIGNKHGKVAIVK